MNGKKAKKLRKMAGFDPNEARWFENAKRTPRHRQRSKYGPVVKGMHVATGARRRYQDLKKAYLRGELEI